ncbi:hypothetical protein VTN96DRAFT_736 [Rasamsonia emersonii]
MRPLCPRATLWSRLRPIISSQTSPRQVRCFHLTRPSPFLNEVLQVSSAFLHGVHSVTGLPWVASIPLTALIVRTAVAMPLQIYSKIHARRQRDIYPLVLSWRKHYEKIIMQQRKERAKERYQELILPIQAQSLLRKNVRQKVADLFKRRKVNKYWRFIPFLQMPIWLSLMEGLRAMCGNDKSLISYLLTSSSTTPEQSITSVLEPSLATEGALWFPDLLAGDPTGVLPITLGLSILLNVSTGWRTPSFGEISDYPRNEMLQHLTFRLLKGGMQTLAIYIGLSAYLTGMPAGLMIYWITSTNIATLQSLFLDKYMFAIKPLKPWTKMYVGILRPGEVKPPSKT